MLRNARGDVRLRIDRRCGNLIRSLDQTIYRPGSREINKKLGTEHSCFHPDQLVEVNGAMTRFSDIPESGFVTGHDGLQRAYIAGGKTLVDAQMVEMLLSDGTKITCTPDHKFLTTNGWAEAKDLYGKKVCNQQLLAELSKNSTEKNTTFAKGAIFKEMASDFIERFGDTITETYQRAVTSITKMVTKQIMRLRTLSCSPRSIISHFMPAKIRQKCQSMPAGERQSGMVANAAESGIESSMKKPKIGCTPKQGMYVSNAGQLTSLLEKKKLGFAQRIARPLIEEQVASMTRSELASFVVQSLLLTNTKKKERVLDLAPVVLEVKHVGRSDAYCLHVPDAGMFCLGDVITSNSDALGYPIIYEFPIRKYNFAGISI
jgi:hypothetical protein